MPLAAVAACPKAIPAKQTMPNKHNVIFIELPPTSKNPGPRCGETALSSCCPFSTSPGQYASPIPNLAGAISTLSRSICGQGWKRFAQSGRVRGRNALLGAAFSEHKPPRTSGCAREMQPWNGCLRNIRVLRGLCSLRGGGVEPGVVTFVTPCGTSGPFLKPSQPHSIALFGESAKWTTHQSGTGCWSH